MFALMNTLVGRIQDIKVDKKLSLIRINVDGVLFSTIVIDTPDSAEYLKVNEAVQIIFKETEVIVGKGGHHAVSLRNQMIGNIRSIEKGSLLSKLTIDTKVGPIISVITSGAIDGLMLTVGSEVTAMVKTNEIMLSSC